MLDFRLKVFDTVAKRLSFTRAAEELYITQPAVTKHIRELEAYFKTSLIERSGNRKVSLTPAGRILLAYAEQIASVYKGLEFEMNALVNKHSGVLRIGASTTVAQYVLPPVLAGFHERFKDVKVILVTGNTEQVEEALLKKEIDLGIIEGMTRQPQISYQEFGKDELVLVSSISNQKLKKYVLKPEELKNYPFLLREPGSGTLEFIAYALKERDIRLNDLNVEMQLGSTESMKSYLLNSNCIAFLSVHAIVKELKSGECRIVDVEGLSITRPFHFIQPLGHPLPLAELFQRFSSTYRLS
ncbi:LysR family transcriptional regulator [Mucilaginibacter limnophilus]|uniref:LysR family transcriptional regulator n=1 Tax=Mucilaginibacter limnophilus TaxID=1932778 RepID=A0A3S2V6J5_9SPHI|nr:LysR family transcriptional regulator [Mucilaginibacter limnophilus]RVT98406.1 LysR family transcriptional regulator [Mucilaginibacter limnophilus]